MSESMGGAQPPEEGSPPGSGAPPPPAPPSPPSYEAPAPPPPPSYGQPASSGGPAPYGGGTLAEWPKRVASYAIDYIAPFLAVFIVGTIFGILSDVLGLIVFLLGYIAAFAFAIYTSYLGGQTGQSIGKQQVGLRLVRESDGQPIGGGLGIGRYFLHIIDGFCFIGYLWPLWDEKKQTFADKILTTVVLDEGTRR